MWIWVGATIAVVVGLMLLVVFFAMETSPPDATATNYSDDTLMNTSIDSMSNQAEIDALGNVRWSSVRLIDR